MADPTDDLRPLDPARYHSPEFMRAEWDRLWPRVWMFVGPAADLAEPGSWVTHKVGMEPLLLTRDEAGVVRGFYNVCQHRGRPLCDAHRGRGATLRCPFHSWTYALDGSLRNMVDPHLFPQPRETLGLEPISVREFAGFLWVNLDKDAEPLESYLGEVATQIQAYRPGHEWAIVEDVSIELRSNWKAGVDVFIEWLHIHAQHPELLTILDETRVKATQLGPRHWNVTTPMSVPSARLERITGLPGMLKDQLLRGGLDPARFTGTAHEVRAALAAHLRAAGPADGFDDSALSDEQLTDNNEFFIFPNVQLIYYARELMVFRHRPHATDPLRAYLDFQLYKRLPDAKRNRPPRPEPKLLDVIRDADRLPGDVIRQDATALDALHGGLRSRGLRRINLGRGEFIVRHMHDVVDRYLATPPEEPLRFE